MTYLCFAMSIGLPFKKICMYVFFIFGREAADIFVFSSDVSVSGRVSFAISSPDSAGVIKENVKRQTGS